jgi:uncharacterized membrane protein YqjE
MDQRTTGELMKDIASHAQELIRKEIKLAKTELKDEGKQAAGSAIMFAAGAVLALFGLGFLLWCATYLLALMLPLWGAALLVGVALFLIAAVCGSVGMARWKKVRGPERSVGELRENLEWLKHPTKY